MKTAAGMFRTSNFQPCQIKTFDGTVTQLSMWNNTPLSGMIGQLASSAPVTSNRYTWMRSMESVPFAVLGANLPAAAAGTTTQIAISDDNMFGVSQTYEITTTREQVLVLSTVGNVAVLKRGVGTVAPQAAPAGTKMFYVGTANEEASFCPPGMHEGVTSLNNLTQIIRQAWSISGTAKAIAASSGMQFSRDQVSRSKKAMMRRFLMDAERARIFGQRAETVVNGNALTKMDGLINMVHNYAPQNIFAAGSTTTLEQLEDMLEPMFNVQVEGVAAGHKIAIGGSRALRVINQIGKAQGVTQFVPSQTSFGMNFMKMNMRRGYVDFVLHPMFDENPLYEGALMLLDPTSIEPVHLAGRESIVTDINGLETNCQDAESGGVLAEIGLKVPVPEANGILFGLTEGACTPCAISVTKYVACLMVDKPCHAGEVVAGTAIVLTIHDAKPGATYVINTPTGTLTMLANASGVATVNYTVTASGPNAFFVNPETAANFGETMWKHSAVSVCIAAPCNPGQPISDTPCVDTQVTPAPVQTGNNATANSGAVPQR